MNKLFILLLLLLSVTQADIQEEKICKEANEKFEQINYLLDKHNEVRGAYAIFERSSMGRYFTNPRKNYKCLKQYKKKWLYLLYKNSKRYPLQNLYKTDKSNYLIPLYLGHIAKESKDTYKALEYYNSYIALKKENLDKEVLKYIKSGGLIPYKSKWAKELNPSGEASSEKFKNIFFSLKNKKIFKTTHTDELNILSVAKLYGHNTFDASSYHIKNFYLDKEGTYNISLRTGNSRACRVIIDGMLFSEQNRFQKKYTFTKGLHKIEIEFLNRNSSYDLHFDMTPYQKRYSNKELKEVFKEQEFELIFVNYSPVYSNSHKSGGLQLKMETKSPEVTIKESKKPVVLILQSTKKVNWRLKNSKYLKAVIVGRHSNLTDTLTADKKDVTIYHSKSSFKAGKLLPENCRCIGAGGIYLCNSSFLSTSKRIEKLLSKSLTGYTFSTTEKFSVPQESVDTEKLKKLREKIEQDKKTCKETQIDKVFKY